MKNWELKTEKYVVQKNLWPGSGRHILGHYNEEAIVVYQAYNKEIADHAVKNQKFGGPWSSTRMTWIKTNFLWMMFRSGWGNKNNQERILAIWLKRKSFEKYITMATKEHSEKGCVRLQWDPDHYPNGKRHPLRKAIQLGLKNVETFINGDDILLIQDITEFVNSQYELVKNDNFDDLVMPEEKEYKLEGKNESNSSCSSSSSSSCNSSCSSSSYEAANPLRVTLSYRGKQKVVVLQGRDKEELMDLVYQKLKVKPKLILSPSGEAITQNTLKSLAQGSILTIS